MPGKDCVRRRLSPCVPRSGDTAVQRCPGPDRFLAPEAAFVQNTGNGRGDGFASVRFPCCLTSSACPPRIRPSPGLFFFCALTSAPILCLLLGHPRSPMGSLPGSSFPVSVIVVPSHSPTQTWALPPGWLEFNAPGSPEATPPFQRSQLPSAETRSASRPRRPRHLHHDLCVTGERSAQLRQREGTGRAGRVQLGFGKGKALPR